MCVFGSPPNRLAQPQKALVLVSSCTWTSSPMTGSYRSSTSGETLVVVTVITFDSSNALARNGSVLLLSLFVCRPLPQAAARRNGSKILRQV